MKNNITVPSHNAYFYLYFLYWTYTESSRFQTCTATTAYSDMSRSLTWIWKLVHERFCIIGLMISYKDVTDNNDNNDQRSNRLRQAGMISCPVLSSGVFSVSH